MPNLEFHQLELRYERLRVIRPEQERRLLTSLAEVGQQVPIVVVQDQVSSRFVVIDGYKRVRCLHRLARDMVMASWWPGEESDALIVTRLMQIAEPESALEQSWLLSELHDRFGLSLEELARRFGHSVSWVSRRLALVQELPDSIQEQVRAAISCRMRRRRTRRLGSAVVLSSINGFLPAAGDWPGTEEAGRRVSDG